MGLAANMWILSDFDKKFLFFNNSGAVVNDLYFFAFELFFLLSVIVLLIFFVILSNKRLYNGWFLNTSNSFINMLFLVVFFLFILLNNGVVTEYYLFGGFYYSNFSIIFFKNLLLLSFFFFLFTLKSYLGHLRNYDFEFILVLFLSFFSSMLVLNCNDLVGLFFVIELQGLTFYVIVSSRQTSSFSTEAGLKYFILGSFSSGVMLFGISLIYGFTGLLSYEDLSVFSSYIVTARVGNNFITNLPFLGLVTGLVFLTVGLLFKLGVVPFHM
jgi:NADH:ubiquinone oxidoreductase subunit 2 (subunit N)